MSKWKLESWVSLFYFFVYVLIYIHVGILKGLDIWRVFMIESLSDELVEHILEDIQADRSGNPEVNSNRVKVVNGVILSFVQVQDYKKNGSLKLYQDLFEAPLLKTSGEYYTSEASKLLQRCTVSAYMEEVIKILEEEHKRAQRFLHSRLVCINK